MHSLTPPYTLRESKFKFDSEISKIPSGHYVIHAKHFTSKQCLINSLSYGLGINQEIYIIVLAGAQAVLLLSEIISHYEDSIQI